MRRSWNTQRGTETLRRHRPTIFLSVHPRYIIELGSSTEELESILEDLDYVLTEMDGNAARPTELTEYIAKPRQKRKSKT